jgi:hypothetical protein
MLQIVLDSYIGTAKDFEASGLKLNGHKLNQVDVSTLGRLGVLEAMGHGDKPARGKTPVLFKANPSPALKFELETPEVA